MIFIPKKVNVRTNRYVLNLRSEIASMNISNWVECHKNNGISYFSYFTLTLYIDYNSFDDKTLTIYNKDDSSLLLKISCDNLTIANNKLKEYFQKIY